MKDRENSLKEFLSEAEAIQEESKKYKLTFELIGGLFQSQRSRSNVHDIKGIIPLVTQDSKKEIFVTMRVHKDLDGDLQIGLGIEIGPGNIEKLKCMPTILLPHPIKATLDKIKEINSNDIFQEIYDKLQIYSEVREGFQEEIYSKPSESE